MSPRYVYSFNGEDYLGSFDTRQEAESAAYAAARRAPQPPATVFVARAVTGDPAAAGHARAVLAEMAARARDSAVSGSARYLANLSTPQIDDLDAAMESAIVAWLNKHNRMPAFFHVQAISEHPVPLINENHVFYTPACTHLTTT